MVIFALFKNTIFKEIFGWMIYNKDNPVLKEIFEKDEVKMPSKSTLHNVLTNTDNNALDTEIKKLANMTIILQQSFLSKNMLKVGFKFHWIWLNEITALRQAFDEDEHIAYKEPYSMAIFRSFALNLFQLYHNENKGRKLPTGKVTMAEINSRAF